MPKKIVIIGPESTGKTELARQLVDEDLLSRLDDQTLCTRCRMLADVLARQYADTKPFALPIYWANLAANGIAFHLPRIK